MCGIFGVCGHDFAEQIILDGLKKLEYRGYDSSGIALAHDNGIWLCKKSGRLSRLEKTIAALSPPQSRVGIGHTRWATHGKANDANAHPFLSQDGNFAVTHNGIIENCEQLKYWLKNKGFVFESDTDSEVVPMLLQYFFDGDVARALKRTVFSLKGTFALAVVSSHAPDRVFAARKDSPLAIGTGNGACFVSSDIQTLSGFADMYCALPENHIAVLSKDKATIFDQDGNTCPLTFQPMNRFCYDADKGDFPHFMLKEIFSQPTCLARAAQTFLNGDLLKNNLFCTDEAKNFSRVKLIGCGSAFHAGVAGKYFFERFAAIPAEAELAGEFRYRDALCDKNTLTVFISQSGETADTLFALRHAKNIGSPTLAVVNAPMSSIALEADKTVYTMAGTEIAVATTKGYTTQVLCLFSIALLLGKARNALPCSDEHYSKLLNLTPHAAEKVLMLSSKFELAAKTLSNAQSVFYIGRGEDYAAAMEGALKLKEISYINANAYAAGELKHGTISLVETGTPVVAIATDGNLFAKTASNIEEVRARGAQIILITTDEACKKQRELNEIETIVLPDCKDLNVIPTAIALQLIAYYTSLYLGRNIDKPRNLAKSVTVE